MPRPLTRITGFCVAATLALCAAPAIVPASAAFRQAPQQAAPNPVDRLPAANTTFRKASLRESLRRETLTKHSSGGFSSVTESQSVAKGKTTIEAELPRAGAGDATAATEVAVAAGGFYWEAKLGDDPKFAPGRSEAKIDLFWPGQNTGSRIKRGTATVKWSPDAVRIKVERESSFGNNAAAETSMNSGTGKTGGKVEGEVAVAARFGSAVARANVPFRATVHRRTAGGDEVYGEAVTADVRGDFKP